MDIGGSLTTTLLRRLLPRVHGKKVPIIRPFFAVDAGATSPRLLALLRGSE